MTATERIGREAESSDLLDHAVRVGLVAYGVVYLMLAFLAIRLAFGHGGGEQTSTKGALQEVAQQPFGRILVWAIAIGMFLLVLWRLLEACFGHRDAEGADRVRKRLASAGKAVLYAVLGVTGVKVAIGAASSGTKSDTYTAKLLDLPAGPWLVGLVGLVIIGYGGYTAWRGWSDKHAKQLDAEGRSGDSGRAYLLFGKIGYIAKGVSLALVGCLVVYAAVTHDPQKSGGMDAALRTVLQQPYGVVMLTAIGLGLGCYGLFCFARARHLSR